ncbi:hypothetical protein MMC30_007332 [Trapelia coarctata]|nr:hypothetical protein [Trapelia coarctata]
MDREASVGSEGLRQSEWGPFVQEFLRRIEHSDLRQDGFRQQIQLQELQLVQTSSALHHLEQSRLRDRTAFNESLQQRHQLIQALEQSEALRAQLENKVLEHCERLETLGKEMDRLECLHKEKEEMAVTINRQEERLQEQATLLARHYTENRGPLDQSRAVTPGSISCTASEPGQPKVTKRRKRAPRKVKVENQATVVFDQDLEKNGSGSFEIAEV